MGEGSRSTGRVKTDGGAITTDSSEMPTFPRRVILGINPEIEKGSAQGVDKLQSAPRLLGVNMHLIDKGMGLDSSIIILPGEQVDFGGGIKLL
jgi:hypothetical protein